jgi:hypothetical protein
MLNHRYRTVAVAPGGHRADEDKQAMFSRVRFAPAEDIADVG